MANKTDKGYISHPPTGEQLERIKAACATTRLESEDRENLLKRTYQFRTAGTTPQVRSSARGWRSISKAWGAIVATLRQRGVDVSDPVVMFGFQNTIERLCFENQTDAEDLDSGGRYPYYWEDQDRVERLAD